MQKLPSKIFQDRIDKFIVVVYKEVNEEDGFIITAYLTSNIQEINRKIIIWKQQN